MDARMERVARKLRRALADTEGMLEGGGDRIDGARHGVVSRFERARDRLTDIEREATYRARRAARQTDHYAHEHPWRVAGIGVALGVAVGLATRLIDTRRF
jgi:ElaB/YqjD/DUF883 family membrane-anchored ribosome-binding protein